MALVVKGIGCSNGTQPGSEDSDLGFAHVGSCRACIAVQVHLLECIRIDLLNLSHTEAGEALRHVAADASCTGDPNAEVLEDSLTFLPP